MKNTLLSTITLCFATAFLQVNPVNASGQTQPPKYSIVRSSFLGADGFSDSVVGAVFRSDRKIVLAANLGAAVGKKLGQIQDGQKRQNGGVLLVLDKTANKIFAFKRVGGKVYDVALNGKDAIYCALGDEGAKKLSADTSKVLWEKKAPACKRIDVTENGTIAVLSGKKGLVFDPSGNQTGIAQGKASDSSEGFFVILRQVIP